MNTLTRYVCLRGLPETHTVAKNKTPSSLPIPSMTLSSPLNVTLDLLRGGIVKSAPAAKLLAMNAEPNPWPIGRSAPIASPSRLVVANAQSISSIKKIAFLGIEEAACCRKASSTLVHDQRLERERNASSTHNPAESDKENISRPSSPA